MKSTRKNVLMVGGRGQELDKLSRLDVRFSMVQVAERYNEKQHSRADRYAILNYRSDAELLPVVRQWHASDPFDAVASFTEYGLEPASRCAVDLGIAGDNLSAVLQTRDKSRMRKLLDRTDLSRVRFRICEQLEDARAFMSELAGQAIVLKPVDRGLSEGVYAVRSHAELSERWHSTRKFAEGEILAEEYLSGPEYSAETISIAGEHELVMVTEKLTGGYPGFVELGHQAPARLASSVLEQIEQLVKRFLDVIGQQTGPVHTELRLTPQGPRLIEAQTRAGGDQIWEMCQMTTGVDLIAETLASLLNLPAPPRTPVAPAAAIRFFAYANVRVLGVGGLDEAAAAPGVIRLVCALREGAELGPLQSSDSRQGYVLCTGSDTDEAERNADFALSSVGVTTSELGTVKSTESGATQR